MFERRARSGSRGRVYDTIPPNSKPPWPQNGKRQKSAVYRPSVWRVDCFVGGFTLTYPAKTPRIC